MAAGVVIIADTATLLFWTLDRERLSAAAARVIEQADNIGISSISTWEIGIKVGEGNIDLPRQSGSSPTDRHKSATSNF